MSYMDLYNQSMSGNVDALETLNNIADGGNAEAQFVLSCIYDDKESPFRDFDLGMYWLQKSAEYKYEPALRKIKNLSPMVKKEYGIDIATNIKSDNLSNNTPKQEVKSDGIWSFDGRIDRATYFVYMFVYLFTFGFITYIINQFPTEWERYDLVFFTYETLQPVGIMALIYAIVRLISLYLFTALFVKRLHDCGHSGWWVLVPFCPVALFFMKGEEKQNEYGSV